MNAKIYSHEGAEVGNISLPEAVFGVAWNADLVHEVVIGMQANARESTAHTKGRGDVRGGGKKPWKQKGTGRARHGSSRSPMWVGGGVSHGPRNEKDYSVKINKKVRAKALAVVLSKKFVDAEVIFVDSLSITEPKTAKGKLVLNALAKGTGQTSLATKRKNTALVVLPNRSEAIEKSFRNFGNIEVMQAKDINPVDLLTYKYVVVADPASALEVLSKRVSVTAATPKK
ncbi:50S ribosomal protein L4 [Candidatus Kaiserbacteria bacterium RIFCSPLOWO2_02_FULL_45_11b]|uniref:Large ribosomal subunit protein uL4 n=1 Tax=Candidatus Kaiserbacteria bacterium RIFCSPLOWO2_12_FULL_45_26 TaxID=1798525 RepID=A0A1F6FFT2_9BACT|nr:MAG: 50S ribosomal protein L4 [Candidatus Kaiserbacteria bacterium RIFCSPHIGHO2_12_45_16]OGG70425.1 MAG: 50S ribosomal protein L4 [Candidatus Kaiserbacteria bacterium RIFCSPLOWO2_01_FULL_45_25]OGG80956.1 MAG: 50S ribosomal protein L4 [Candidatus Kaiserbacteria bacterium RIFCSPLOWO2_02_FULL_45_11b]OGG84697.1 MAG: 50S ribosomal protein L4 [Candidatus Kaiserbacteria bacterium RIFCSPLOWO2_12_FULL_45_26]